MTSQLTNAMFSQEEAPIVAPTHKRKRDDEADERDAQALKRLDDLMASQEGEKVREILCDLMLCSPRKGSSQPKYRSRLTACKTLKMFPTDFWMALYLKLRSEGILRDYCCASSI